MCGTGITFIKNKSTLYDKTKRLMLFSAISLILNTAYALTNIILGLCEKSYWYICSGAYFLLLAVMRFGIIYPAKKISSEKNSENVRFIRIFTGSLLIVISIILCINIYLSIAFDVTKKSNEIIVITMATYAFTKITLAIINFVKRKSILIPNLSLIRNIGLADAAVSIFSLQKSMLVSFGGMSENDITIMNSLTGTSVCIFVMLIGIGIIYGKKRKNDKNGNIKTRKGCKKG